MACCTGEYALMASTTGCTTLVGGNVQGKLNETVNVCRLTLRQLRDEYFSSGHPTLQDTSRIPEEFEDPMDHQALAFQYYEHAYEMWLNELDEFVEANEDLDFRYSKLKIFSCQDAFEP